ncbi:hypothetical protein NMY22_g12372 [Coprinellus aureogranulatus]|nr:hypothetical protein NMY22_g12372 [Coprinellus aureogranulatus]
MKLPWVLRMIDGPNQIRVQSRMCKINLSEEEKETMTCSECKKLANDTRLRENMERAGQEALHSHTPYKYLNAKQMIGLTRNLQHQLKDVKMKYRRLQRKINRLEQKINLRQKILVYISNNKIPAASRILARAIRRGESDGMILEDLVRAASGSFKSRTEWSAEELDLANLGGGIRITDNPTQEETNTRAISPSDLQRKIGQVLMLDDVSIEAIPRYDIHRNCVVGMCREHSHGLKATLDTMEDVDRLEAAFLSGKVHHGTEATVLGLAPVTAADHYYVSPVGVTSGCHAETGQEMGVWLRHFLDAYRTNENGEKRHGPVYAIATDGASTFRSLRFSICHEKALNPSTDLGAILSRLSGMNMQTGPQGIIATCDPKHIIKRFATLLRSRQRGITVGTSVITSDHVSRALRHVGGLSDKRVQVLLNPTDKQNVPVAVNLLQSLMDLEHQAPLRSSLDDFATGLMGRIDDLQFIAKVFGYFLKPFIDVKMPLSEQIRSLSTYSHLLTYMYRKHGEGFITTPLFTDSQSVVKNIIFTTARLQLINPKIPYYILLEGTDRLEGVFASARTHDHSRNFDILQLSHKLSIGAEINAIYQRRPHLDPGHRRLNLVNARGIDHINPASWDTSDGKLEVGSVDIAAEYLAGRDAANDLIAKQFGESSRLDYDALFAKPDHDHLRPEGSYIGAPVGSTSWCSVRPGPEPRTEHSVFGSEPNTVRQLPEPDLGRSIPFENSELPDREGAQDASQSSSEAAVPVDVREEDETDDGESELLNPLSNSEGSPDYPEGRLALGGGSSVSKHTLVAQRLASTSIGARKSIIRTHRVRGDTKEGAMHGRKGKETEEPSSVNAEDEVSMGDPGVVLVNSGTHVDSVPFDDLYDVKKSVSIAVQFLELRPQNNDEGKLCWVWTGEYLQLAPISEEGRSHMHKNLSIQIAARSFYPAAPDPIRKPDGKMTWAFAHDTLKELMDEAYSYLDPNTNEFLSISRTIPTIDSDAAQLPLRSNGQSLSIDAPQIVASLTKHPYNTKLRCKLCHEERYYAVQNMRNHVGKHILKAHRAVSDELRDPGVEIGFDPCGWCGSESCRTQLTALAGKGGKVKYQIDSDCEYHWTGMNYEKANEWSKSSPSTNRPILCTLCPVNSHGHHPTFWKYNFFHHMVTRHHDEDSQVFTPIPQELRRQIYISLQEEQSLGIESTITISHRETFKMPPTSPLQAPVDGEDGEEDVSSGDEDVEMAELGLVPATPGRKRAISSLSHVSTSPRQASPSKKRLTIPR